MSWLSSIVQNVAQSQGVGGAGLGSAATPVGWAAMLKQVLPSYGFAEGAYNGYQTGNAAEVLKNLYGISQSIPRYDMLYKYRR